jgi:hypothetical protein
MWDGLSSPSLAPTLPPPPGQPGKAVLQPAQDSLQWLAYKPGAVEHSCGTGFLARSCHPLPRPPGQPRKAVLQPAQDSLERLSHNPRPGQPGKAGLETRDLGILMWDGLSSPSFSHLPHPLDSLERLSYDPHPK